MTTFAFYFNPDTEVWQLDMEGETVAVATTQVEICQDLLAFMHLDAVTDTAIDNYIVTTPE